MKVFFRRFLSNLEGTERRLQALALAVVCASVAIGGGCESIGDDRLRAEVQQLTLAQGEVANAASQRLARHGRRVIPSIEAALHTADVPGRKNLVMALRRIGDVEGVALLAHLAANDPATDVQREALWTLRGWAKSEDERGLKSREALRRLDENHQREEAG